MYNLLQTEWGEMKKNEMKTAHIQVLLERNNI